MAALPPVKSKSAQTYESSLQFPEDNPLHALIQRALPKNEAELADKSLACSRFGIRKALGVNFSFRKAVGGKALSMGNQTPYGEQLIKVRAQINAVHRWEAEFATSQINFKQTLSLADKERFLRAQRGLSAAKEELVEGISALIVLDDKTLVKTLFPEINRLLTIYGINKDRASHELQTLAEQRGASSLGELEAQEGALIATLQHQKTSLDAELAAALDQNGEQNGENAVALSDQISYINQVVTSLEKPNSHDIPQELTSLGEELIYVRRLIAEHKQVTGDVQSNAEKQAIFASIFPQVAEYLIQNPKEGIFRVPGDDGDAEKIEKLLEDGAPIPDGTDPISVSIAFKRIIKKHKIHGRNLLPEQQEAFRAFCNALVETEMDTKMTYKALAIGWGGVLRNGIDPASIGYTPKMNRPDLMDYGFVDLFGYNHWDVESYRPRLTLLSTPLLVKQLMVTTMERDRVAALLPDDEKKDGDVRGLEAAEGLQQQLADLNHEIRLIEGELQERGDG